MGLTRAQKSKAKTATATHMAMVAKGLEMEEVEKGMKGCLTAMESIGVPCPQFGDCVDHLHFSLISILLQKLLHALRMTFRAPFPTAVLPSPRGCKNLEKMASLPLYACQSIGCGE